jgi:hypothetical protein
MYDEILEEDLKNVLPEELARHNLQLTVASDIVLPGSIRVEAIGAARSVPHRSSRMRLSMTLIQCRWSRSVQKTNTQEPRLRYRRNMAMHD